MKSFREKDSRLLVDCAMGRKPADLVIRNGKWVSVQTGEVIPNTDIAVIDQRIAYVGPDASHTISTETKVIDADGKYLVPGLVNGHMHVESGMLTVTEFVRAVLPLGTTAMFVDPHEIANVFGLEGVQLMIDEAALQPNHVFVQLPSCVPSAPGMETPGATITPDDVMKAMNWDGIIGLGEMMNFPGVVAGDENVHKILDSARQAEKIIGGHYASHDLGLNFHGYVAGGPMDDHEGTTMEGAIARARQGLKVMMRLGSAEHDVAPQVKAITEAGLDPRNFLLCTDDQHSATLIQEGHMDHVVRHTIAQGVSPISAIQMATINVAEYFGLATEIGQIAPGRYADILFVSDLALFRVDMVVAKGIVAAEGQQLKIALPNVDYPDWVVQSVHVDVPFPPEKFIVKTDVDHPFVMVNTIGIINNQVPTEHLKFKLAVNNSEVKGDIDQDVAKIAVVDRHHNSGSVSVGFVHGFGFTEKCAVGSTVAHDSHQLIVAGTDDELMAQAVNELVKIGGGQVVVKDGRVIGEVELPIAGLMSDQPAKIVAEKAEGVLEGFRSCGSTINNPNMQLSFLALVVIPSLRLSDKGLFDVNQFRFIPLIEKY